VTKKADTPVQSSKRVPGFGEAAPLPIPELTKML
jgi:hypothetical protein